MTAMKPLRKALYFQAGVAIIGGVAAASMQA